MRHTQLLSLLILSLVACGGSADTDDINAGALTGDESSKGKGDDGVEACALKAIVAKWPEQLTGSSGFSRLDSEDSDVPPSLRDKGVEPGATHFQGEPIYDPFMYYRWEAPSKLGTFAVKEEWVAARPSERWLRRQVYELGKDAEVLTATRIRAALSGDDSATSTEWTRGGSPLKCSK